MHDQEHRTGSDGSNRYPAILIVKVGATLRQGVRIVEHENCGFKANIVLAQVFPVFVLVPSKRIGRDPYRISAKPTRVNIIVRTRQRLSWFSDSKSRVARPRD